MAHTELDPRTKHVLELRRAGGYGKHSDRRTKRLKTRGTQKAAALREQR